jgi:hypothetical protein
MQLFIGLMRTGKFIINAVLLLGLSLNLSCKKQTPQVIYLTAIPDSSYLSVTNASSSIASLLLYVGTQRISLPDSPLSYGSTTFASYTNTANPLNPVTKIIPYIKIPSGYQQLSFRSSSSANTIASISNYFESGNYYSAFITDTATHGQVTCIFMQDEFGVIDSSEAQIRFLNLSPDSPPMDLWAFPNAGANGYKLFSNCTYLPLDYNALVGAQSFALIKPDPYYFVATQAGTYNAILSGGLIVKGESVSTIYSLGYLGGSGLNLINANIIQYNQ